MIFDNRSSFSLCFKNSWLRCTVRFEVRMSRVHNTSRERAHLAHVPDLKHTNDSGFERKKHIRPVANSREELIND